MIKNRLDIELVKRGLVPTRSQAESYIKLGQVTVDGVIQTKPGFYVRDDANVRLTASEQYVSRAGLKLASVAKVLQIDFQNKIVLDVGSSTGGFTDYSLQHGASQVLAVDVGTDQLHPSLRNDERISLYEKTDIRDFVPSIEPDIILIDVSFISLKEILPHLTKISTPSTQVVAMLKPQFEAGPNATVRGVIKNDARRRQILKDFEDWVKQQWVIVSKRDSDVAGAKGNRERFYILKLQAPSKIHRTRR
ncbi:hypothetical protein B7Y94_00250 [Candidatus Saccharibacteria bacterium 32-49-12]|nr:MAG: hypothetical protein B7Y94_00250 [Candidatus Saccharibacteria bacterium 32-49-12]